MTENDKFSCLICVIVVSLCYMLFLTFFSIAALKSLLRKILLSTVTYVYYNIRRAKAIKFLYLSLVQFKFNFVFLPNKNNFAFVLSPYF